MAALTLRRDVRAVSHLNIVVEDIDVATEFCCLGFEQSADADVPMDYPGVALAYFARDAGFDDGLITLDIRFLSTPRSACNLELFTYHWPQSRPGDPPIQDE